MPCNCDHLMPNQREKERLKLAQWYCSFLVQTGQAPSKALVKQANDYYGDGSWSFEHMTETLCSKLRALRDAKDGGSSQIRLAELLTTVRDFSGEPLAVWWTIHQLQDAKLNNK